MSEEKRDICKVCGREVGYYKIDKGNGKSTHRAIHIGDSVSENATEISKYSVSSTYRNRMRQAFKHDGTITPVVPKAKKTVSVTTKPLITPTGSSTGVGVLTGPRPDDDEELEVPSKLTVKEKLDVPKVTASMAIKPVIEFTELHEFPEGSEDKPELDVSEIKRNKFAAISAIARKLAEAGKAEKEVNEIRSALISNGGDFPGIVNMASEHLRFVENGQPLFFRQ